MKLHVARTALVGLAVTIAATASLDSGSGVAALTVRLDDVEWTTKVASAAVLPGEALGVELRDPQSRRWSFETAAGTRVPEGPNRWTWHAPRAPGIVEARLSAGAGAAARVTLKLLVAVPATQVTKTGLLNGYRIGAYPSRPLNGNALYLPPRGFVEVTRENQSERLSPRFRLGQFTSKQSKAFPKYVVIEPGLIARLERLASRLEQLRLPATLHVMSGYRTPFYNRAIGNVQYSLHQWGVAADVFVDEDGNGVMDDLNRDGRTDREDAVLLSRIIDGLDRRGGAPALFDGGLGIYSATRAHGPFVHVDVRGRPARW